MKILAIETSCDETAVAFLKASRRGGGVEIFVLGSSLLSQTPIHTLMGGVVPSLAKREHSDNLIPTLKLALEEAKILKPKISGKNFTKKTEDQLEKIFSHEPSLFDAFVRFIPTIKKPDFELIAVTEGPGLEPALWVGINFAKALSLVWNKPVTAVNHMEGHILSSLLKEHKTRKAKRDYALSPTPYPLLSLLISGGHTELVLSKKIGSYKIIGETRDDALGEAFDKAARMLGLPYPGGPQISRLAEEARAKGIVSKYSLPRPMLHSPDLDFSFAGLKTAVLYTIKKNFGDKPLDISSDSKIMIAREFEDAVTEVLVHKVREAIKKTGAKTLAVGGGVIANKNIRRALTDLIDKEFKDVSLHLPTIELTTDNAVMIGLAASIKSKKTSRKRTARIKADGNLRLD